MKACKGQRSRGITMCNKITDIPKINKKVIMEITKVEDISSLEYQLSYASKGDIPRGAIGTLEPKGKPVKQEIVLGTCSDVCHYDQEVSDIKLLVRVTKTDNKIYSVEHSL